RARPQSHSRTVARWPSVQATRESAALRTRCRARPAAPPRDRLARAPRGRGIAPARRVLHRLRGAEGPGQGVRPVLEAADQANLVGLARGDRPPAAPERLAGG